MLGSTNINYILAANTAMESLKGVYQSLLATPAVFLNGLASGILAQEENASANTLEPTSLTEAEAQTEASCVFSYAKRLKDDFQTAYQIRKNWYDELEKSLEEKSISELISDRYIDSSAGGEYAIKMLSTLEEGLDSTSKDRDRLRQTSALASTAASVFLSQLSSFASYCGSKLNTLIPSERAHKGAEKTLFTLFLLANSLSEMGIDILKIPFETTGAVIGGAMEGVGKMYLEGKAADGSMATSLESLYKESKYEKEAIESIRDKLLNYAEEYSKHTANALKGIDGFDEILKNKEIGKTFIKDLSAASAARDLVLRKYILEAGGFSKSLLEKCDKVRANIKGFKMFFTSGLADVSKLVGAAFTRVGMSFVQDSSQKGSSSKNIQDLQSQIKESSKGLSNLEELKEDKVVKPALPNNKPARRRQPSK